MALDDDVFLGRINDISRRNSLRLPAVKPGELPPASFLAEWAKFLEDCVRGGVPLSDERWQRLTVVSREPQAVFSLEASSDTASDPDFRVGLQLFLGLLGEQETDDEPE